ncbi:MAG: RNA polymerase sigma factor [Bacteroidetes bacterium]|nr:RNA polymerase sigma factor [bacterium]NBP64051.1 RNA polymerase sigma factor [Bacteroidota bacterium]
MGFFYSKDLMNSEGDILDLISLGKSHQAMNLIMSRFKRFVFSIAIRYMRDEEDAKDITQEAFIKAYQSIETFRGDSHIRTWLYAITRNLCLNALDKQKRKGQILSIDSHDYIELPASERSDSLVEHAEFTSFFNECMSILPEKQRETFILRHVEELSYEEISTMLGTSIGGLKANYFQAVQKLAQYLESKDKRNAHERS